MKQLLSMIRQVAIGGFFGVIILAACANSTAVTATIVPPTEVAMIDAPPTEVAATESLATAVPPTPVPTRIVTITPSAEPTLPAAITAWDEDLTYFKTRLTQIHPDPFYRFSEAEYDQALDALRAAIPTLTDTQIMVELARIVAFVDGHSAIQFFNAPANFQLYSLHLYQFSDGLYVLNAEDDAAIGGKVVRVGALSAEDAIAALRPYIPNDNPSTIMQREPYWLIRPEVLLSLGIIDAIEAPEFVIESADGSQITLNPTPLALNDYRAWNNGTVVGLLPRPDTLYLSRPAENLWYTYLESSDTLYIQYNHVMGNVRSAATAISDFLDEQPVERVVFDIRLNPGGNNTTYPPVLDLLSTHPQINQPGKLFIITGRQTFSAAANFTTEVENDTHAIFVGEPMGGSPNLFGDIIPLSLPNSGLRIYISARYWEMSTPEDRRLSIAPDLPAPLSSQDYFADRDPALEAILAFDAADGYRPKANPIITPLAGWESADVRDPYVIEVNGTYYLFYTGKDEAGRSAIGYATSQNGRKWFRASANPILTGSDVGFDGNGVAAPVVIFEDGVWTLYYAAVAESGEQTTAIGKATATRPNGSWERSTTPLLTVGEGSAWDSRSITTGSVVSAAGEQRLYYSGFSSTGEIGIGLATSTDGEVWTKFDDPETTASSDPIMAGAGRGSWDEIVWAPFVQQREGVWEMFYHGDPISARATHEIGIGLATSDDGLQWTRASEPFLVSTDENRFPHTPNVLAIGDSLYLYYASVQTGGTAGQIELEILPR